LIQRLSGTSPRASCNDTLGLALDRQRLAPAPEISPLLKLWNVASTFAIASPAGVGRTKGHLHAA
jgi:hypothetical protein